MLLCTVVLLCTVILLCTGVIVVYSVVVVYSGVDGCLMQLPAGPGGLSHPLLPAVLLPPPLTPGPGQATQPTLSLVLQLQRGKQE